MSYMDLRSYFVVETHSSYLINRAISDRHVLHVPSRIRFGLELYILKFNKMVGVLFFRSFYLFCLILCEAVFSP
jgi:hypothetical protein